MLCCWRLCYRGPDGDRRQRNKTITMVLQYRMKIYPSVGLNYPLSMCDCFVMQKRKHACPDIDLPTVDTSNIQLFIARFTN